MKLYHFTSVAMGEAILASSISEGHLARGDGTMRHRVAWLTTDPYPGGHGLLTGKEVMDESNRAFMKKVQGELRNNFLQDKTKLRITVDVQPGPTLVSFVDYCKQHEPKGFAKTMGLSTLFKLDKLTDKEFMRLYRTTKTKEGTWWLSFEPVARSNFTAVHYNAGGNKFVPYDFELHGRAEMVDVGLVAPSAAALAELRLIAPALVAHPHVQAVVFCEDEHANPTVEVRLAAGRARFDVTTRAWLDGDAFPSDLVGMLGQWIGRHEQDLHQQWLLAVDRFHHFYPDRRRGRELTSVSQP